MLKRFLFHTREQIRGRVDIALFNRAIDRRAERIWVISLCDEAEPLANEERFERWVLNREQELVDTLQQRI